MNRHINLNDISFIKIQEADYSLVWRRNSGQLNSDSCEIPWWEVKKELYSMFCWDCKNRRWAHHHCQTDLYNLSLWRWRLYNWSSTIRIHVSAVADWLSEVGLCGCTLTRLILCEQVFSENERLDWMMLTCRQWASQRFLLNVTWKGDVYYLQKERISSQAVT